MRIYHLRVPYSMWPKFAWWANQHPKSTVKKKKPTNLCAPRELLKKMCLPCLIIVQSCYFGYTMNKPFACSAFRALFTWSWRITRAKDHRLFLSWLPTNLWGRIIRSHGCHGRESFLSNQVEWFLVCFSPTCHFWTSCYFTSLWAIPNTNDVKP